MVTPPSVRADRRHWGSSSGVKATGRTTSKANPTIFPRSMWYVKSVPLLVKVEGRALLPYHKANEGLA